MWKKKEQKKNDQEKRLNDFMKYREKLKSKYYQHYYTN